MQQQYLMLPRKQQQKRQQQQQLQTLLMCSLPGKQQMHRAALSARCLVSNDHLQSSRSILLLT
jgi:hypothetical protein